LQKGFNSDIHFAGSLFHIQTEDWGRSNPYFVSRVFKGGAVLKSIKVAYEEILPRGNASGPDAIGLALELQHKKILDLLLSGQLL